MRTLLFSFRHVLLATATLLLFTSSPTLLIQDAHATKSGFSAWVRYRYYSDASYTTQVGQIDYNYYCNGRNQNYYSGTQTTHYTIELISQCSFE